MTERYWVIITAAGSGQRMQHDIPKQYLKIHDKTILEHTLHCFLLHPKIDKILVAVQPSDVYWEKLELAQHENIFTVLGGGTRMETVWNSLHALKPYAQEQDWVLVHDAVRPCLQQSDINKLIERLNNHPVGGLLGSKVKDTLKSVNENNEVIETLARDHKWCALTPQMFRYGKLFSAMQHVIQQAISVTDDASALEFMGDKPLMIEGHSTNIKITYLEDLVLAEKILSDEVLCSE